MLAKPKTALSMFLIIFTASVAVAKDNNPPTIDLQERCRTSVRAAQEMLGNYANTADSLDACMKSEQASRDAIAAIWKEIPPSYKASCIDPRAYSASYIEWIACLELYIDVKKQRSNKVVEPTTYSSKICPIIKYLDDGSIVTIHACAL
jgi:hypothetical protein